MQVSFYVYLVIIVGVRFRNRFRYLKYCLDVKKQPQSVIYLLSQNKSLIGLTCSTGRSGWEGDVHVLPQVLLYGSWGQISARRGGINSLLHKLVVRKFINGIGDLS